MRTALKFVGVGLTAVGVLFVVIWGITKLTSHFVSEEDALGFMLMFGLSLFLFVGLVMLFLEFHYQLGAGKRR